MKIPSLLKDTLKAALLGGIAGVALAFALPPLAHAVGVPVGEAVGHMANPLWMGTFVAAFNVTLTLVQPAVNYLFGDKEPKAENLKCGAAIYNPSMHVCVDEPAKTQPQQEKTPLYAARILNEYAECDASVVQR